MSIVTKKARKALSIATVVGLAAGLLTGIAAPANAAGVLTATPVTGMRAENNYDGEKLAGIKLVSYSASENFTDTTGSGTPTTLGTCTWQTGSSAPKTKSGVTEAWCDAKNHGGTTSNWVTDSITVDTQVYNTNGMPTVELLSAPAGASEYSEFFKLDNVDVTTATHTTTAELQFRSSDHAYFSEAGAYKFRVYTSSVTLNYVDFTVNVGGVPTSVALTTENGTLFPYNYSSIEFSATMKDKNGVATELSDDGNESLNLRISGALAPIVGVFSRDSVGTYVLSETSQSSPVTSTSYVATADFADDATAQVASNVVTISTGAWATSGSTKAVAVKNAVVVAANGDTTTVILTQKSVTYKFTGTKNALVKFDLWVDDTNNTGITSDDTTAANDGLFVRTDADGHAMFTVVTTGTPKAGDYYEVATDINGTDDTEYVTYQDAGYDPSVAIVAPTYRDNTTTHNRSVSTGSTLDITAEETDIFGLPVKGDALQVHAGDLYESNIISQNTDANGQAKFTVVDKVKTVRTSRVTVSSTTALDTDAFIATLKRVAREPSGGAQAAAGASR